MLGPFFALSRPAAIRGLKDLWGPIKTRSVSEGRSEKALDEAKSYLTQDVLRDGGLDRRKPIPQGRVTNPD